MLQGQEERLVIQLVIISLYFETCQKQYRSLSI
jgi:hypothetical protein